MVLFAQWNYWAFAIDDWQDFDTPARRARAAVADHGARLIRTVEAPALGLLPRAADRRAGGPRGPYPGHAHAHSAAQVHRGHPGLGVGATWQTADAERDHAEAQRLRGEADPPATAPRFTLTWCDVANGIDVPARRAGTRPCPALTDAAGSIVSRDNDLFS